MSELPLPLAGAGRAGTVGAQARRWPLAEHLRAYVAVTDPRSVALLVFTACAASIVAGGLGSPARLFTISLALALASMGARAVANYVDRDLDAQMERTRRRPLPSGVIAPSHALVLGLALIAAGLLAALPFGPLVVGLIAFGLADNLLVYARLSKRTTPASIVLGAPSGGTPALVGYVAIAGAIDPYALMLAAFVVLWTPIHIWSLAIRYRDDYARAGIPMLPVVIGVSRSARYVGIASLVLAVATILFVLVAGPRLIGPIALAIAVLALALLVGSLALVRRPTGERAWGLFKFTAPYLGLLFALLALNAVVGG